MSTTPPDGTARGSEQAEHTAANTSKVPLFGARAYAKRQSQDLADALADNQRLRAQLEQAGSLEVAELQRLRDQFAAEVTDLETLRDNLLADVARTREENALQEIGIYEYRHPLSDSVAYRDALKNLQSEIKAFARRDGGAIEASKAWVVEGSVADGRKMLGEYSKLMLRAYNAEAENLVRSVKPHKLDKALERLDKLAHTLEQCGRTMHLRVAPQYHRLRCRELELTADHLELLARQKDYEREERERIREDRRAHEEWTREQAKLERQQKQGQNTLTDLEAEGKSETDAAIELRVKLAELEEAITTVKSRAANIRGGYVYVVSNIGSFGDDVVQIGVTRRFDPRERIRDLSNPAVPFGYDRIALFYDDDAAGIEDELHRRLEDKRINKVNRRREFFRVTPAEVREHLRELTDTYFEFTEQPEAVQYHQSRNTAPTRNNTDFQ